VWDSFVLQSDFYGSTLRQIDHWNDRNRNCGRDANEHDALHISPGPAARIRFCGDASHTRKEADRMGNGGAARYQAEYVARHADPQPARRCT